MNYRIPSRVASLLALFSLLAQLCFGAAAGGAGGAAAAAAPPDKISPELRGRLSRAGSGARTASVILQLNGRPSGSLNALLNRNGVHVRAEFKHFGALALDLPLNVIEELASHEEVSFVSPDSKVASLGHVATTTGLAAARAHTNAVGSAYRVDGHGIGVAVLDSSVYNGHVMFAGADGTRRIVRNVDFVCTKCKTADFKDMYGHGTHVAGLLAGNGQILSGAYEGVAPGAKLFNLRVLDSNGAGTVTTVLQALDWVMSNRADNNIRVVNISLGAPAVDSYKNDPLCKAVRRLVDAGVVVVAAAGNNGRTSDGQKVYGMIHSPGNEPSAITVGATNTFGTDARADDGVATFSSRGPTRSFWTDEAGVKHYDHLVKPDLVAPGNKIISSARTSYDPFLPNITWPEGKVDDSRKMLYLSGSSMAAPLVSGAAALLLQANPKLTPNMVKMLLMYTAQPLAGYNTLEQGVGQLNIEGALRLARLVRTDLNASIALGAPLLTGPAPTPSTDIAGHGFQWAQGILLNYGYATGDELVTRYQKVYGGGILLGDGIPLGDSTLWTSGILLGDSVNLSDGSPLGGGAPMFRTSILFGDGILLGDSILFGDGILLGDSILFGDGILLGDAILFGDAATAGDDTACMK